MKSLSMKLKLIFFGTILISLYSCGPKTSIRILKPADIMVSDQIQNIGTIDRSVPESGFSNVLEGLLTGEDIGQDKRGRREAISGFTYVLTQTPRFNIKAITTELTGSKSGATMAEPLSWAEVDKLCKDYKVDGLAVLELFDSDLNYNRSSYNEKYKDKNGKEQSRKKYQVERKMEIRTGFRLYDNVNKIITDEFVVSANDSDSGNGDSGDQADRNLTNIHDQVKRLAQNAGKIYAKRIAPLYVTEDRAFQRKVKTNKDSFEKALEAAKREDWVKAGEIWNSLSNSTDPKTAGKAAYNMAIVSEAQGQLNLSLEWAEKAYNKYNLKAAKSYISVLKNRIADQEKLQKQMKSRQKT